MSELKQYGVTSLTPDEESYEGPQIISSAHRDTPPANGKRPRRVRKDAGVPRPPKPKPDVPGVLSVEQVVRLRELLFAAISASEDALKAKQSENAAWVAYNDYLDSLTKGA